MPTCGPCNGHPDQDPCLDNIRRFSETGKDPYRMLLERAHETGLEFFASVRMNDTHYKDQAFSPLVNRFYYDNLHNRVGRGGSRGGAEFDYRKTAVRDHYFGIITDAVDTYDVDGVELNFTRNCCLFPQDL